MIYVPEDSQYVCYVVQNENTIRAYDTTPSYNTSYNYKDYYINSHYLSRTGTGTWSNYTTLPTCIDTNNISHDVMYRNDFDSILIIFLIFSIFAFYIPIKIFMRLFRRFN